MATRAFTTATARADFNSLNRRQKTTYRGVVGGGRTITQRQHAAGMRAAQGGRRAAGGAAARTSGS